MCDRGLQQDQIGSFHVLAVVLAAHATTKVFAAVLVSQFISLLHNRIRKRDSQRIAEKIPQSTFAPESFTTFAFFSDSMRMKTANSSGLLPTGS